MKSIEQAGPAAEEPWPAKHPPVPEGLLVFPAVPYREDESESPAVISTEIPTNRAKPFRQVFWLRTITGPPSHPGQIPGQWQRGS